ncbi:MAG: alpha/beta hydrolase [Propionibacteriaceae bacterium]|jgi:pimeloyl-ACP methyl ester carboxylesterase|nr:alpha/beta hydrolase [Propionibacteriaceae bacterium]
MDTPLLIFLHGPGQSPPVWQDVVGAINPEQPMVAPWLKGLKPTDHGGFDMDQAVTAVVDLMEARGAKKADLVGYSLGGLVALRVAAAYPDKVAHVVAISAPLIPNKAALKRQRTVIKLTPAALFKTVNKEQVLAAMDALLDTDMDVDLGLITAPVLAITASSDPIGQANVETLARDAHAMTRVLPAADPNLLTSEAAKLAQLIADFCADFLEPEETPDR